MLRVVRIAFNLGIGLCCFLCGFFRWAWTGLWSVTATASGRTLSTSRVSHQFSCALMTIPLEKNKKEKKSIAISINHELLLQVDATLLMKMHLKKNCRKWTRKKKKNVRTRGIDNKIFWLKSCDFYALLGLDILSRLIGRSQIKRQHFFQRILLQKDGENIKSVKSSASRHMILITTCRMMSPSRSVDDPGFGCVWNALNSALEVPHIANWASV